MGRMITRRSVLAGGASLLAAPAIADDVSGEGDYAEFVRRNLSGFKKLHWQDHFDMLGNGAIVADTSSRALHFWSCDAGTFLLLPTSGPRSPYLSRSRFILSTK